MVATRISFGLSFPVAFRQFSRTGTFFKRFNSSAERFIDSCTSRIVASRPLPVVLLHTGKAVLVIGHRSRRRTMEHQPKEHKLARGTQHRKDRKEEDAEAQGHTIPRPGSASAANTAETQVKTRRIIKVNWENEAIMHILLRPH